MAQFGKYNFMWLTLSLIGLLFGAALTRELPDAVTLQILEIGSIVLL
ncbi:MAG: hypothetical protein HKP16_03070, partial [Xanthomonadales bacterium]|nr:hypothetical protein [Xanthomonadales bacterium]